MKFTGLANIILTLILLRRKHKLWCYKRKAIKLHLQTKKKEFCREFSREQIQEMGLKDEEMKAPVFYKEFTETHLAKKKKDMHDMIDQLTKMGYVLFFMLRTIKLMLYSCNIFFKNS